MIPRRCGAGHGRRGALGLVVASGLIAAWSFAACAIEPQRSQPARPTPTPGAPTVWFGSDSVVTFHGDVWTVAVVVESTGEPTEVVAEWGTGTRDGPFDHLALLASDVTFRGTVSGVVDGLPSVAPFCIRFRATNEHGTARTSAFCWPGLTLPTPS